LDKARPIIAIALCLIIWAVYFKWFSPKGGKPPAKPPVKQGDRKPADPKNGGTGTNGGTQPELPPDAFKHPEVTPAETAIENDHLRVELSTLGGGVRRLILRKHGMAHDKKVPLALLDEMEPGLLSMTLREPGKADSPLTRKHWEPVPAGKDEASYRYTLPDGLRLTKTFALGPERHALRMKLTVENLSAARLARSWELVGAAGLRQEAEGGIFPNGVYGLQGEGKVYSIETDDLDLKELVTEKPFETTAEKVGWVGATNKFFACALFPADVKHVSRIRIFPVLAGPDFARMLKEGKIEAGSKKGQEMLREWTSRTLAFSATTAERTFEPGETWTSDWVMYAGPKSDEALEQGMFKDQRLSDVLDFGWFSFISRLLLWILHGFHWVFGNFGVAIIGLVLVVRAAIFPISKKGQVSMFKMSKLQPHIKALQEKHQGDPVRLNKETMALFKTHGVSPFGGCLPIFLQIPVFFGLYNALLYSIDLRAAPFFGWIDDLSRPDNLFALPFSIFGATHFHLLPIVMIVTWFTQAYLQPRSPDPQMAAQQRIFMFMPIFIGVMMYGTPAGLVLYWLVSTCWGIAEQQLIKKVYLK
jgi:YidC/Oxa1 family membrane protein insertase